MFLIVKTTTDSFYSLQLPSDDKEKNYNKKEKSLSPISSSSSLNASNEIDPTDPLAAYTSEITLLHANETYELACSSLDTLLQTCLDREMTSENLKFIFKYLEPWITSVNDHERLRSMRTLFKVLRHFADNYKLQEEKNDFDYFGKILGSIIGRSADPVIPIRLITIDCIENLLKLYQIFTGTVIFEQSGKQFEQLLVFKQKLTKSDSNILLGVVSELAKVKVNSIRNR